MDFKLDIDANDRPSIYFSHHNKDDSLEGKLLKILIDAIKKDGCELVHTGYYASDPDRRKYEIQIGEGSDTISNKPNVRYTTKAEFVEYTNKRAELDKHRLMTLQGEFPRFHGALTGRTKLSNANTKSAWTEIRDQKPPVGKRVMVIPHQSKKIVIYTIENDKEFGWRFLDDDGNCFLLNNEDLWRELPQI